MGNDQDDKSQGRQEIEKEIKKEILERYGFGEPRDDEPEFDTSNYDPPTVNEGDND